MGAQKKIMEKLLEVARLIDGGDQVLADRLSNLAVEALFQGKGSKAWETYMIEILKIFGNTPAADSKQLRRLTFKEFPTEADIPDYIKSSNVYIVSNAICGMGTTTRTSNKVDTRIDDATMPPE